MTFTWDHQSCPDCDAIVIRMEDGGSYLLLDSCQTVLVVPNLARDGAKVEIGYVEHDCQGRHSTGLEDAPQ